MSRIPDTPVTLIARMAAQKSKDIYRAYVLEEKPIGEVAKAFGVSRNVVSQIKTRVDAMIADFEAMLRD